MKLKKQMRMAGWGSKRVVFRAGGFLWVKNTYGQQMTGKILGFIQREDGTQLTCWQRECWPTPEFIDLNSGDYPESRYSPPAPPVPA